MSPHARKLIVASVASVLWIDHADAGYSGLVMFGDSLSDIGNVSDQTFGLAPGSAYFDGRYSNGPLWVESLAQGLSLPAPNFSRDGGRDYAYAGVKTGSGTTFIFPFSFPNLGNQINSYLGSNTANATTLYTVWGGGNDFIDGQTNAQIPVNNLVSHVTTLANAGAKNIVVPNLPPLGETPRFRGTANQSVMNTRTSTFNGLLATAMTNLESSLNVNIFQLDVAGFFADVLANPGAFGFTNVTGTALVGNTPAPNQDEYLFWDDIHPTRIGHNYLGTFATELVLTHDWISTAAGGDWAVASNWDPAGVPQSDWITRVINTQPSIAQAVSVQSNSQVNSLIVAGNTHQMTLIVQGGVTLTVGDVEIDTRGRIDLFGGMLDAQSVHFSGDGIIGGSGTITGDLTNASGTVAPGNPGQVLNVGGNFDQGAGGSLEIELAGVGSNDRLNVAGSATLAGDLRVGLTDGFVAYPGLAFNVLSFTSRTGDLTIVNETGLAGLHFTKSYSSTLLTLETTGLGGDANLDGTVNANDFTILATNFGTSGRIWLTADFNADGIVNANDFSILATNFGLSATGAGGEITPQDWATLAAAVPEPGTFAATTMLSAAICHLHRRRDRACRAGGQQSAQ